MNMYRIIFHQLVLNKDIKGLPKKDSERIIKTIYGKLSLRPEFFGKRLCRELKDYYSLRIGFYRVIYSIRQREIVVQIIQIGLRHNLTVYIEAAKRLKLIP